MKQIHANNVALRGICGRSAHPPRRILIIFDFPRLFNTDYRVVSTITFLFQ